MQISIWEKESFYSPRDIIIIGSGLVGLWSAYYLKKKNPRLSVAIVDRGIIPTGASTRNAGFACFGSLTELLEDMKRMGTDKMLELVSMRYKGIQKMKKILSSKNTGLDICGGYELINEHNKEKLLYEAALINKLLSEVTDSRKTFGLADKKISRFGFSNVSHLLENKMEGYLHSGKLCLELLRLVQSMGVTVLTSVEVKMLERTGEQITLITNEAVPDLKASKVLVCTNAFARQLLPELDVVPARGQVLLTSPVAGLRFKGSFHYDGGYYYFRNLGNRVLLGGARNKSFEQEQSYDMQTTPVIQNELEYFLSRYLLPDQEYQITDRWSGIMGMGSDKMPLIREVNTGVFCAVRMNGMGVALSPVVGEKVAGMLK